jgi:hypothetical protein
MKQKMEVDNMGRSPMPIKTFQYNLTRTHAQMLYASAVVLCTLRQKQEKPAT